MVRLPVMSFSPGPVEASERTLQSQARQILYHYDPAFLELFKQVSDKLQRVFATKHDVIIMQGEAILGLEAAAACLFSPGDKVLVLASGPFGKGYGEWVKAYGAEVIEHEVPSDDAIDPADVEALLRQHPDIKFLSVVHSETPAGTLNPVKEICQIAHEAGVISIVDAVSSLGGSPLEPDAWGMDVVIAGPQKCLGAAPGLTLAAISPRAWEAMENKRDEPLRGSYLSMLDWKDAWIGQGRFPYTPSVADIYSLDAALTELLEEGLDACIRRHTEIARACRAGVRALGLRVWPKRDEIAGTAVTAVAAPDGIDVQQLTKHLRAKYGVTMSTSVGDLSDKLFRLGHMGRVAHPAYLAAQLAMLERALADLGYPVKLGSGVGAAMEALGDW